MTDERTTTETPPQAPVSDGGTKRRSRGLGHILQHQYPPAGMTYREARLAGALQTAAPWWISYSHRGKRYEESSDSSNRMDAVRLLKRRLGEIGRGQLIGRDAERVTFEDLAKGLINDYTINGRRSTPRAEDALTRLRECFGDARALDITPDRVQGYIRSRLEAEAAPGTIDYELAILKRAFTLAVRDARLPYRPYIPSLTLNNTRTGFSEAPEMKVILGHLSDDIRSLVEFLYLTGWRVGEAVPLTWAQVDFRAQVIRLEPGTTKNSEGRTFPFSTFPELATLLHRQREATKALEHATERIIPWVFHRGGEPIKSFKTAWQNACKAAGVPGRLVHDLRRTAVRNLERAGVPRSVAMKLTGHKTESVYRRYAIVNESDLAVGVAKLARLHEALGAEEGERKVVPLSERTGEVRDKSGVRN